MLNETFINTATKFGAYKVITKKNKANNKPRNRSPPWFDHECPEQRRNFSSVKNMLKWSGSKAMCYKKAKDYKKFLKHKEKLLKTTE